MNGSVLVVLPEALTGLDDDKWVCHFARCVFETFRNEVVL